MASRPRRREDTDLALLLPGRGAPVDPAAMRRLAERDATVVAVQVPSVTDEGWLDRDELGRNHYQHGVDLARLSPALRLRDVLLLKLPEGRDGEPQMALASLWNSELSRYDIDAVRIPWHEIPGPRDKRNNPKGKNPTNLWAFSAPLDGSPSSSGEASSERESHEAGPTTSCRLEAEAVRRLVRCHAGPGATVHVAASGDDASLLRAVVESEGRAYRSLPAGEPDELVPAPLAVAEAPLAASVGRVVSESIAGPHASGGERSATARFVDCREGLASLPRGSVTHAVTSPPYNIGYEPFNVTTVDRSTGRGSDPGRKGYDDDLSQAQYAGLLQSTFEALDAVADSEGFELFLDVKNNYQGGSCRPPFFVLRLMPERWRLLDLLVWRYDISYDPARLKYKPVYEWVLRVGFGAVRPARRPMADWYIPILKGNSAERRELRHPAMFPRELVHRALAASRRAPRLVVDPFVGSGTTLAACLEAGVDSLGFEVEEAYLPDVRLRLRRARDGKPGLGLA